MMSTQAKCVLDCRTLARINRDNLELVLIDIVIECSHAPILLLKSMDCVMN